MTTAAPMPVPFPFAAIAGQPQLRQALLLAAVDPGLGGVLIEGPRGTAKTTAARALAELLPGAPFVTLPLGASLESLVGTLDLGQALAGHELKFAPGLLARAHGGVLYVDEINLLPDALIDSLLDAGGERRQRGRARRHLAPACGALRAGRHDEPGRGHAAPAAARPLRPVRAAAQHRDATERQAIVRARLAFDADPQGFRATHATAETELVAALARARAIVADRVGLALWRRGARSRRARCALHRAGRRPARRPRDAAFARALAAWDGASAITTATCSAWPRRCCCTGASREPQCASGRRAHALRAPASHAAGNASPPGGGQRRRGQAGLGRAAARARRHRAREAAAPADPFLRTRRPPQKKPEPPGRRTRWRTPG
jgi:magnesium chelatase subunit I